MNKVVIVSAFDNYSYNVRIKFVEKYFVSKGYNVTILAANFDHRNKTIYSKKRENLRLIPVLGYKKNLSIKRIISHKEFAKKAFKIIENDKPEIVYVSTPPNFLFKYAYKYKKNNLNSKIIFEIGDMWPETLPINKFYKFLIKPFLFIWENLRNKYIKCANGILFECDLFKDHLAKYVEGIPCNTIYLTKELKSCNNLTFPSLKKGINVCYVGSLNNIFDECLTSSLLNEISKKFEVSLHLIGDGEKKQDFLKKLKGVAIHDYGIVYDEQEKAQIYSKCHFSLNLMNTNVFVGLTMKSIEYFYAGLPVINNIPGDTERIINMYKCGFNYDGNNSRLIQWLESIDNDNLKLLKSNTLQVYNDFFTTESFNKLFDSFIKEVIK